MAERLRNQEREERLRTGATVNRDAEVLAQLETQEEVPQKNLRLPSVLVPTQTETGTLTKTVPQTKRDWKQQAVLSLFTAVYGDEGPSSQFAQLFEDMAIRLQMGIAPAEALRDSVRERDADTQALIGRVAELVTQGVPLSKAFQVVGETIELPHIIVPVLEVGERDGRLELSLRQLAFAFRHIVEIEHRFDYSVANPAISVTIGVLCALTLLSPALFFLGGPMLYVGAYTAGFAASAWAYKNWRKLQRGKTKSLQKDAKKLRRPLTGMAHQQLTAARWTRTFHVLWQCGVPISQALEVAAESAYNFHYRKILLEAAAQTRAGHPLSETLERAKLLPPHLLDIVKTGEMTGEIGPSLAQFADYMEEEAKMRAAQAFAVKFFGPFLLGALLTAILALLFAWFYSARQLPDIGMG